MASHDNRDPTATPFRQLGLDPRQTPEDLTEAMREMAEDLDVDERRRLQGLWRELTLHPDQQLDRAFFAHAHPAVSGRQDLEGLTPEALVRRYGVGASTLELPEALTRYTPNCADLVVLPALRLHLGEEDWPDVDPTMDMLLRL